MAILSCLMACPGLRTYERPLAADDVLFHGRGKGVGMPYVVPFSVTGRPGVSRPDAESKQAMKAGFNRIQ